MAYATLADLAAAGLVATAYGTLTSDQKEQALEDASRELDSYFRGRFALPLLAWDTSVTKATLKIAVWNLLALRGFNPASGSDMVIRQGYEDAIAWARGVQRQAIHPTVTEAVSDTTHQAPRVISSSASRTGSSARAQNRGW